MQLTETSVYSEPTDRLCLSGNFEGDVTSIDSGFLKASGDPHFGTDRGE